MIGSWKDPMQLGIESCSVDNILNFHGQDYGLVFNNLIGDRLGSGLHIPKELFDVSEPIHHDVYYFKSRDLKKLLTPLKKALVKCNKRFEFVTLHEGFPLQVF